VPGGPSIACSTAKAIEWDAQWSNNLDPSGRAALGVHDSAYEQTTVPISLSAGKSASDMNKKAKIIDIPNQGVIIST
jgi:asparagine synthase (glutamine-hydrolysing)